MKPLHLLAVIVLTLMTAACGGGGASDNGDGNPDNTNNDNDGTPGPAISGFDFTLNAGDFWEYEWDYFSSTVSASGGSSGTRRGVFRITLGAPVAVGGLSAFPLIASGNNRSGIDGVTPLITPRWTHIAVHDNQVLLSDDGIEFRSVFDADSGRVIGFGFFEQLSDQHLFQISQGSIDNDYISGPALVLSDSDSESDCQFFPGYGTICGAGVSVDFTRRRSEYYQPDIGPVGYFYHFSASSGGTFDSVSVTNTLNVGLVASSRRGDVVGYALETEFNNTPGTASSISTTSFPVTLKGDFNYQADIDVTLPENYASTYFLYLNGRSESEPNDSLGGADPMERNTAVRGMASSSDSGEFRSFTISGFNVSTSIEDWYYYEIPSFMPIDVLLENHGFAAGADMDLWLFDSIGTLVDYNISDDAVTSMRPDMPAGRYYIGVDIWPGADSSPASAEYSLSLTQTAFPGAGEVDVDNRVAIRDFYRLSLSSTTGLTITSLPSIGMFVTELDGRTVLASAPRSVDALTDSTTLSTPVLSPGDYLIAVGSQNYHHASTNLEVDTYELTIEQTPAQAQ